MNWLGRRNWGEAEKAAAARLAAHPDDERTMADLAEALRRQGRFDEALAVCERKPSARLLLTRAKVQLELDQQLDAKASLESALALNSAGPEDAESVFMESQAASMLGADLAALESAQRAVVLNPTEPRYLAHLGLLLIASDPALAEQRLRQSLKLDPEQAEAQNNLGAALLQQKRSDEAYEAFKAALELAPDFNLAAANLWGLDVARRRKSPFFPLMMVPLLGATWLAWTSASFGREPKIDWPRMGASLALMVFAFSIGAIRDRLSPRSPLSKKVQAGMSEGDLGHPGAAPVLRFLGHLLRALGIFTILGCAIGEVFVINHYLEQRVSSDFLGMGLLLVGMGAGALFIYEARNLMRQAAKQAANRG